MILVSAGCKTIGLGNKQITVEVTKDNVSIDNGLTNILVTNYDTELSANQYRSAFLIYSEKCFALYIFIPRHGMSGAFQYIDTSADIFFLSSSFLRIDYMFIFPKSDFTFGFVSPQEDEKTLTVRVTDNIESGENLALIFSSLTVMPFFLDCASHFLESFGCTSLDARSWAGVIEIVNRGREKKP